jgi:homoserine kinase
VVVNRARAGLILGCQDVMRSAKEAGALGSSISGSGPSIFAFCHASAIAPRVAKAMVAAFEAAGLAATAVISPADCPGARVI